MTAADSIAAASEQTPLLSSTPPKTPIFDETEVPKGQVITTARKNAIILILAAFILAIGIGEELISPAQTRVLEAVVCRHYYETHDPAIIKPGHDGWWDDESRRGVLLGIQEIACKLSPIQGEVAMLKGWQTGLESIGSLILAIPYGWFADKYGRKPLLLMVGVGIALRALWQLIVLYKWQTFDIRMMWISAFHSLLGGGGTVAAAVVFTAVTDITDEAERTSTFFRVTAASIATTVVSPPVSAWLMRRNPWIAIILGLVFLLVPVPFLSFMPETLRYSAHGSVNLGQDATAPHPKSTGKLQRLRHVVTETIHHSIGFLAADPRLGFLIAIFTLHLLMIIGAKEILLQYASARYAISLSKSTLILAVRAGVNLFLLLFIFPALTNWVHRRPSFQAHPSFADLQLARGSALIMAVGFLIIAMAGHLPLYIAGLILNTAGWGFMTYVRSIALSLVNKHNVARLFAVMGLTDTVGMMLGAPLLAKLFEIGASKGSGWIGLPFLTCAAMVTVACIGLGSMRPGELAEEEDPSSESLIHESMAT